MIVQQSIAPSRILDVPLNPRGGTSQRGVTLVESLIALLVLAIALLGVASLQLLAQRDEIDARARSMAVTLGGDLFEQLRLAPEGIDDLTIGGDTLGGCSATTQALCERIRAWQSTLATRLPNAAVDFASDSIGGRLTQVSLSIGWRRAASMASPDCRQIRRVDETPNGCIHLETVL
ncbi:prepilin-type N-terminal cleavage/methylation domain-containing protein [Salinicola halophilus]|uniref:prepilin-type N-terminal cleavage/methylation domain-containing protein n=1 Tax=Salinicola halophilus TaxID=184065 RepID=UPI001EF82815|nr:prepilin-type N-terminal cleavage/methylation domain-containing protein [Salinicola halophilus]